MAARALSDAALDALLMHHSRQNEALAGGAARARSHCRFVLQFIQSGRRIPGA
jgi:hypothetical protein